MPACPISVPECYMMLLAPWCNSHAPLTQHPSHPPPFIPPAERPAAYQRTLELAPHIDAQRMKARLDAATGSLELFFPYRRVAPAPQPRPRVVVVQQSAVAVPVPPAAAPRPSLVRAPAPAAVPAPRSAPAPAPPAAVAAPAVTPAAKPEADDAVAMAQRSHRRRQRHYHMQQRRRSCSPKQVCVCVCVHMLGLAWLGLAWPGFPCLLVWCVCWPLHANNKPMQSNLRIVPLIH